MRTAAFLSLGLALVGAGSFVFAASGGDAPRGIDVSTAKARTAQAASVHYSVAVTMAQERRPLVLHISGATSRDATAVHLQLSDLKLDDGTTMPGATGAILMSKPFLYERAPDGIAVFGNIRWLRVALIGVPARSTMLSTVRALTPSPLLRIIGEARLHRLAKPGAFAGPVAYDDPIVRTALHSLGGGLEFRGLRMQVQVGRDGLIRRVGLTGRTPDGKTSLTLRARLYAFGVPVKLVPPKPGTFVDQQLAQLGA